MRGTYCKSTGFWKELPLSLRDKGRPWGRPKDQGSQEEEKKNGWVLAMLRSTKSLSAAACNPPWARPTHENCIWPQHGLRHKYDKADSRDLWWWATFCHCRGPKLIPPSKFSGVYVVFISQLSVAVVTCVCEKFKTSDCFSLFLLVDCRCVPNRILV